MPKSLIAVGLAILLAAAVGGGLYWSTQQPRPFVFAAEIDNELRIGLPRGEIKVLVDGVEVPVTYSSTSDTAEPKIRAPGGSAKEYSAAVLPKIEVQYRTPCGWKPTKITIPEPRESDLSAARRGDPIPLQVIVEENGWVDLYTDNRDQAAHGVELGGVTHNVGANSSDTFKLPQDSRCREGGELKMDGRLVGALPKEAVGRSETTSRFLFDTTGRRCYLYKEAVYGAANVPEQMQGGPPRAPREFELRTAYLHALPDSDVEYFLRDFPEKIVVPQEQLLIGAFIQASVLETPCATRSGKKGAEPKKAPRPSR